MDIARFMPNFGKTQNQDLTEEELDEQDAAAKKARTALGKHGPRRISVMTNGQYRRMGERRAATEKRKANRRFRKDWLEAEEQFSRLQGQIFVALGIIPATPDMQRTVTLGIHRAFAKFDEEGVLVNDPLEAAVETFKAAAASRNKVIREKLVTTEKVA